MEHSKLVPRRALAAAVAGRALSAPLAAQSTGADTPPSPPTLAETGPALDRVQLVGGPLSEEAGSYSVGHLGLDFGGGSVYAVTTAGVPVGVLSTATEPSPTARSTSTSGTSFPSTSTVSPGSRWRTGRSPRP